MAEEGNGRNSIVNFQNVISLGNALIILSMLASVGSVLMFVGREVQGITDQQQQLARELAHEIEMRVTGEKNQTEQRLQSEKAIVGQIGDMTNQESRDVQSIKETLQNMRDDYRELLRVAGPQKGR